MEDNLFNYVNILYSERSKECICVSQLYDFCVLCFILYIFSIQLLNFPLI